MRESDQQVAGKCRRWPQRRRLRFQFVVAHHYFRTSSIHCHFCPASRRFTSKTFNVPTVFVTTSAEGVIRSASHRHVTLYSTPSFFCVRVVISNETSSIRKMILTPRRSSASSVWRNHRPREKTLFRLMLGCLLVCVVRCVCCVYKCVRVCST